MCAHIWVFVCVCVFRRTMQERYHCPFLLCGTLQTNNITSASLETSYMLLKMVWLFCGLTCSLCPPKIWGPSSCLSLWAAPMLWLHAAPQDQRQLSTITLQWGGLCPVCVGEQNMTSQPKHPSLCTEVMGLCHHDSSLVLLWCHVWLHGPNSRLFQA